jgi:very-short-patch-repair endonuclease
MMAAAQVPLHAQHGEGDRPQDGGGVNPVRKARTLRREMSLPERLLWQCLRGRHGLVKFRRQHPCGPYVPDFYCASARLTIEIDGESHSLGDRPQRDERRDAYLRDQGLDILHIPARDVLNDPDAVADNLMRRVLPLHHATHGPPPHPSDGEELHGVH